MNKQGRLVVLCFVTGVMTAVCINKPKIEMASGPLIDTKMTESDLVVKSSTPQTSLKMIESASSVSILNNEEEQVVGYENIANRQFNAPVHTDTIVTESPEYNAIKKPETSFSVRVEDLAPDR